MFGFLSKVFKPVANIGKKVASSISNSGIGSKVSSLMGQAVQGIKSLFGFNVSTPYQVGKEAVIQKGGMVMKQAKPFIQPIYGLYPPKGELIKEIVKPISKTGLRTRQILL